MNPARRALAAWDIPRHYGDGCLTRQQATAITLTLLNPIGDRPEHAVIALSAASSGWDRPICAVELRRVLLVLAPAFTELGFADLRRLSAELADTVEQIRNLESDQDQVDAYLDDEPLCWDRRGEHREQLETLRSNAGHLRDERLTVATWLVGGGRHRAAAEVPQAGAVVALASHLGARSGGA
jgi:hypothetical protein